MRRFIPLALALTACSSQEPAPVATATAANATAANVAAAAAPTESQLVDEIAQNLQACSYDGAPVSVDAQSVGTAPPSDCRDMVAQIMKHTGLPQNFDVIAAPVPNAAAVVLLDQQKLPRRVIAFNPQFIDIVRRATEGNAWAPASIMAHEIGHHLSGHTIMPGGSQPPTELEADKFSGFVLFKMGASLGDAQKAMATLVADGPDGPTHPGRAKRLAAISDGWRDACVQAGKPDCATSPAPISSPAKEAPREFPPVGETLQAATGPDVVPTPGNTPSKFDRFVYDEFGYLDAATRKAFEEKMFATARDHGVEIVTLLVDDLHGMSAQEYAWAMMRQLRVGKMDVGNGAVVVAAPRQNEAAIAMGPGLLLENASMSDLDTRRITNFIDGGWAWCEKKRQCGGWTENFFGASEHLAASAKHWEWTIRYPSLGDMVAVYEKNFAERMETGARYEPKNDPTWRKLARMSGTVVSLSPPKDDKRRFVGEIHEKRVGPAMLVKTDDGREAMLYVTRSIEGLMPAGKLSEGKRYSFVVRESNLSMDTPQLDLLSYDVL